MSNQIKINKNGEKSCGCFKRCGGCQLAMPYNEQLEWKQSKAERMLSRFAGTKPIIGMDMPYNYRNKVQTVFRLNQRKQIISGVYQASSGNVVSVDDCMLENIQSQKIVAEIKKLMKSFKIYPYDARQDRGTIRHVMVRCGKTTGQIMVCIVTPTAMIPSRNSFVKALLKTCPDITTIVQNICSNPMPLTLGDRENVLYGKGYIEDVLCGCKFKISSKSFYQVNPVQTEKLYSIAVNEAKLNKNDIVIDAYCGIGTIGIICADKVRQVLSTELNKSACKDAVVNAKLNKLDNIKFANCDAGEFMEELVAKGEKIDVVIMDPPRAGSDRRFLESLAKLSPDRVVYVSCKIETLERDLKLLKKLGYKAQSVQPVDMFPHTTGIETVTVLNKI